MKTCKKCGILKELEKFSSNKFSKDGHQGYCKVCKAQADRKSNFINQKRIQKRNIQNLSYKNEIKEDLKIKLGGCCRKCGEKRLYVLDFHHLGEVEKTVEISTLISHLGRNNPKILEEAKKCILLCSNCHREFHFLERKDKINIKEYINAGYGSGHPQSLISSESLVRIQPHATNADIA